MQLLRSVESLVAWRRGAGDDLGFVPTMGALHAGHLALVREARAHHHRVLASIFVNPKQFGPHEDLARYPQPLARDIALLRSERVDAVFAPEQSEIYPTGFSSVVEVRGSLTSRLEGALRPGHFSGVATVVTKLLSLSRPTTAFFGQKDAQQVLVVSRVVADLNLGCAIHVVPTVREPDGLALSSRNVYLAQAERASAPKLYAALTDVREQFEAGERDADVLRAAARHVLESVAHIEIEYVSIADLADLAELQTVGSGALVALACRLGTTRLIDNVLLGDARLGLG